MGNKESRVVDGSTAHQRPDSAGGSGPASPTDRQPGIVYSSSRPGRGSRPDLSFLGIGSSSHNEAPEGRRETKQEREVRKAEKERVARVKEREKSIKEEHVDGGFLVTMGVYTGHEDFSKPVVRQLMVCSSAWLALWLLRNLTYYRLNEESRPSGEALMISKKNGQSIS